MTRNEQQVRQQPSPAYLVTANRLANSNQQNNLGGSQPGQASSLNSQTASHTQQHQPTNSPWTIQRRLYVISYPVNNGTTLSEHKGIKDAAVQGLAQTNQTTMTPRIEQTAVNTGQTQAIVQVFEQTQHFTGNRNTPATGHDKFNNGMYQYPGRQPINQHDQANIPKIDNLFNLWN